MLKLIRITVAGIVAGGLFSLFAVPPAFADELALRGRVVHASTGEPIAKALVRIPDLSRSTRTDAEGRFAFPSLPTGRYVVGVHAEGFENVHTHVTLPRAEALDVALEPLAAVREVITVAATPFGANRLDVAPSVDIVDASEVRGRSGLSVGGAVGDLAGARNVSTGDQAGKPMIRGLTNERIRVLTDGYAHNYQQFSLRHPPNVEPYDAERIEVVRGPASVLYGPDALGGVVNLVSAPLLTTAPGRSTIHGELLAGYTDNADAFVTRGALEGAAGGFGYSASFTKRDADDTETPRGDLANTGYDQASWSAALGYAFGNGARVGARYSHWENEFGFFLPPNPDFRLWLDNDVLVVDLAHPLPFGEIELSAHRANNNREAFPLGFGGPMPVDLEAETRTYRAQMRHAVGERLRGWVLVERYEQENGTFGLVPLLPNFESETWSVALYEELRLGEDEGRGWSLSAGLRYDTKELDVKPTAGRAELEGFTEEWDALSGSLGAVYRFAEEGSVALSLGRGWRAPSEYELFAEGQHTGVAAFERGNSSLVEETNINAELSFEWQGERLRANAAIYRSEFDDHVYAAQTDEMVGMLPVVEYRQTDATLEGYEAFVAYDVFPGLSLFAQADHVSTKNEATGRALPVTPPDRWAAGARWQTRGGASWHSPFVQLRATRTDDAEASGADELFSREDVPGYTLFDLSAGIHRRVGATDLAFDLAVRNLTDREYIDFLDTYKQWFAVGARSPGRSVRVTVRCLF